MNQIKIYNRENLPKVAKNIAFGFGPYTLAYILLFEVMGVEIAEKYFQKFKWEFVEGWKEDWEISDHKIKQWIDEQEKMS